MSVTVQDENVNVSFKERVVVRTYRAEIVTPMGSPYGYNIIVYRERVTYRDDVFFSREKIPPVSHSFMDILKDPEFAHLASDVPTYIDKISNNG